MAEYFRERSTFTLEARCPVPIPEQLRLGDKQAFMDRVTVEICLARRAGTELHVLAVRGSASHKKNPRLLAQHVEQVGASVLRNTDGAYATGPHRCAVVLPTTGVFQAEQVADRLLKSLLERCPDAPYGEPTYEVLTLSEELASPDDFFQAILRDPAAKEVAS